MTQTRDFISIGRRQVRHSTAARDWVCGTCGGKLAMHFYDVAPNWRTVCGNDETHDDQSFIHWIPYAYIKYDEWYDTAQAREVLEHLPAELQAAIAAE